MNPVASFLLHDCFWTQYDAGDSPDKTALLTGFLDEVPLIDVVCARFGVSRDEAEAEVLAARSEVEL